MDLRGKRALITGGALRVGKTIALALAKEGCAIALHYGRSEREAETAQRELRALGADCVLYQADLSRSGETLALGRAVLRHAKGCQILVNNASIFPRVPLERSHPRDFDLPYSVNLRAPALLTQVIGLELMRRKRSGRIVNIADSESRTARPEAFGYSLSKAGLLQLTRLSASALAPWVLVNSISPGTVLLPTLPNAAQLRSSKERSLLKRVGNPEEIAAAVLLALRSDFMTGADLLVDGGRALV
ncbi:MAG: SDR family NAD(P)-dependent oxidoreductase [bacterium]